MSSREIRLFVLYGFFASAAVVIYHALSTGDGDLVRVIWASIAPLALWALGGRPGAGASGK